MRDDSLPFWIGDGPEDASPPATKPSDRVLWLLITLAALAALAAAVLTT